ncbi:MAG: EI24 domain-containing protein [Saprospiraceae bacterium]
MLHQIIQVLSIALQSISEIWKKDVWIYVLLSGCLAMLLFAIVIALGYFGMGHFSVLLASWIPITWTYETTLYTVLLTIAWIIICLLVFKYLLLITLSPLLSFISEKIEKSYSHKIQGTTGVNIMNSAIRAVRINGRNIIKEITISILLFLLSFILGLQVVTVPLLFMVQTYFLGFGFMDFYLERHHSFSQTIPVVYKNKWAAIGIGSIFSVLFAIPIFGMILAPYVATVSATLYFIKSGLK